MCRAASGGNMNIFDILGPVMVGPSSSHTAGAVRIGCTAAALLGERVAEAKIGLHGSFAATGKGHGTDRALVAGLLGMRPDDMRIPESFEIARREQMKFEICEMQISGAHPNTAYLKIKGESGKVLEMEAASVGGGRIRISRLDGIDVSCSGDKPTLILNNVDQPRFVAGVTTLLAQNSVNIATMNLYRDKRGGNAVTVIESDQEIPEKIIQEMKMVPGLLKVTYLKGGDV